MTPARFYERNFHIPKLQLVEVFPLTPFLWNHERVRCFDVGANTGLWCEAFLEMHGARTVDYHAFEPMPGNLDRFRERQAAELPRFPGAITLNACCVGARAGDVEIHYDRETTTLASVANTESDLGHRVVALPLRRTVPQISLDAYCAAHDIGEVHLLKIDVEGYEGEVIEGARGLIAEGRIRNVFFEFGVHQARRQGFREVFQFFTGHGFELYKAFRGRNYFGLNRISRYDRGLEPQERAVDMYLATRDQPSPAYTGPRVLGQLN